nr:MAG TPA_asm: hypothetical protein [Caudoviricetes sp.]
MAAQITSRITTIFQCFFAKRFVGIVLFLLRLDDFLQV